jgi:hypothetical protein
MAKKANKREEAARDDTSESAVAAAAADRFPSSCLTHFKPSGDGAFSDVTG